MDTRTDAPLLLSFTPSTALVAVGPQDITVLLALDAAGNAYVAGSTPRHQAAERFVAADQELLDLVTERALNESRDAARSYWRTGEV
jgi:predicted component of type VI protein secretion system